MLNYMIMQINLNTWRTFAWPPMGWLVVKTFDENKTSIIYQACFNLNFANLIFKQSTYQAKSDGYTNISFILILECAKVIYSGLKWHLEELSCTTRTWNDLILCPSSLFSPVCVLYGQAAICLIRKRRFNAYCSKLSTSQRKEWKSSVLCSILLYSSNSIYSYSKF